MTVRERFFSAVTHRQPDAVPYHVGFTQKAREKMAAYYGDPGFEEKLGNCFTFISFEGLGQVSQNGPDLYTDPFGVTWDRSVDKDIGVVRGRLITEEDPETYVFPDPDAPELYQGVGKRIKEAGDTVLVGNYGFSLFERAWTLTGMEDLLCQMASNKPFANALLDRVFDYAMRITVNMCEFPFDVIRYGDDWGHQGGIIMGAPLWREMIKPRVRRLYAHVKSKGKYVMIHSCGNVTELFPDLAECGVDIFNPFQPEVMDTETIKNSYGDRMTFFGGISTQRTLPYGTPRETREEVEHLIALIGRDGGYIASPAHDIPGDAKVENIAAMMETLRGA